MKDYYISINGEQSGPFTIEELKEKKLTDEYLVWTEAFGKWLKAGEVFHLRESLVKLPPPLPGKKFAEKIAIKKALIDCLIPFCIVYAIIFISFQGFLPEDSLKKEYPEHSDMFGYEIRLLISVWCLLGSSVVALFTLIIDYRFRILKEISRLNI